VGENVGARKAFLALPLSAPRTFSDLVQQGEAAFSANVPKLVGVLLDLGIRQFCERV
jgi:hypothetical protein